MTKYIQMQSQQELEGQSENKDERVPNGSCAVWIRGKPENYVFDLIKNAVHM